VLLMGLPNVPHIEFLKFWPHHFFTFNPDTKIIQFSKA